MESPQPDRDGAAALKPDQFQERVNDAVTRLVREGVRLTGTQRQTGDLLTSLGYTGRNGEHIGESTISGWYTGRNTPTARQLVALVLYHRISADEVIHGVGLRADFDRLRTAYGEREEELGSMQRQLRFVARTLIKHLELDSGAAGELERIARAEAAPD